MTFPVLSAGTSAYNLQRSLRFRASATAYLNRTPGSTGSSTTWTWSGWIKRGVLGDGAVFYAGVFASSSDATGFQFRSDNTFQIFQNNGASTVLNKITTQVFRDPSAWYHLVCTFDTTNATAEDRVRLYVNGVRVTSFSSNTNISLNGTTYFNSTSYGNRIFRDYAASYLDGYLTEFNFIDGQALTPSSFGSTNAVTGVWQPAKYTGTYGTNGFYLPFTNLTSTSTLGNDFSGNSNNWTTNNISLTSGVTYDSMTDVPTLTSPTAANFATLNPLVPPELSTTFNDGNLRFVGAGAVVGSMGMGAKTYVEMIPASATPVGVGVGPMVSGSRGALGSGIQDSVVWFSTGGVYKDAGGSAVATYATFTTGDVCAFTFDPSNRQVTFYKNNVSQGSQTVSGTQAITFYNLGNTGASANVNFGQRPFAYTPPSGFVALNTFNLPSSTIPNGANFMAATLYTGTGSAQSISNAVGSASFQPDFVWQKARAEVASNRLVDSVRGTSKVLYSNNTNAEATTSGVVDSFNSGGFTGGGSDVVTSGYTAVAWQWKGGGTAVTNTSGSITSTVSANTTSGFSVVTYTGTGSAATVGHGLNVAPAMVIAKSRSNAGGDSGIWVVYHKNLSAPSYFLYLNQTNAETFATTVWNNTAPTSTVFSIGSASGSGTASTHVAYCFAPIAGFSAFGSYTGNGSTDGPFVYTGFRPRWLMIKRTDTTSDWYVFDSARNTFNSATQILYPNLSNAEVGYTPPAGFDLLSNGFKSRETAINASGGTYVYAAFAENPFRNSLAR